MKRGIKFFLTLGMICVLTACSSGKEAETSEKEGTVQESSEAKESSTKAKKITYKIYTGETINIAPEEGEAAYRSSDKGVVKVEKDGTVLGMKHGKAMITMKEGKTTSKIKVVVNKRGMVYPEFTMMKGEHLDLQFSNATVVSDWVSDDPEIASVTRKGKVTAKKKGSTTIHGTDGKRAYLCRLTVKKKIKNIIYLTFDDGPNRYTTPKALDILKKNKVKATFFELKPAVADFDLTQRVIDEGHTLAMHGYQHKYDIVYRSVKIYKENLDKLQELFFKKMGVWCTVSRFPGGSSNMVSRYNPGVMTRITKKIHGWGYHYFDWNVSSGDSDGIKTSDALYRNVLGQLSKKHDNVILMHDYVNNDVMLGALDRIIKYGKKNGFTFLPITASTEEVHHRVNN